MFSKPIVSPEKLLHVRVVAHDCELLDRVTTALNQAAKYHVEQRQGHLYEIGPELRPEQPTSLLILGLSTDPRDLTVLRKIMQSGLGPPAVIVIADGISEEVARTLLKLQVADWLSKSCSADEIVNACSTVLQPAAAAAQARCVSFVSAIGGAGSTTLALSWLDNLLATNTRTSTRVCVVDLNFQSGVLADYLDLEPRFVVSEVAGAPERLDWRLAEVMLAKHRKGFSLLAAPASLDGNGRIRPEAVGQLLDILSSQFDHLIIDVPTTSAPCFESVLRGSDHFFIITNMTVTGLRQARRMADQIHAAYGSDTTRSVIVNKATWRWSAGVGKQQAKEVIGSCFAGFVPDVGQLATEAQNRGVLLSELRRSDPIRSVLGKITQRLSRSSENPQNGCRSKRSIQSMHSLQRSE